MKVKMAKDKYYGKTLRKNFARHEEVMPMPNLLEIQKTSYREFLDTGLREVFADVGAKPSRRPVRFSQTLGRSLTIRATWS